MAVWFYNIDLSEENEMAKDLEVPFETWRDATADKLESSDWFQDSQYLKYLTSRLRDAEDPEEFHEAFELVYDAADVDRAWINVS